MNYFHKNFAWLSSRQGTPPGFPDLAVQPSLDQLILISRHFKFSIDRLLTRDLQAEAERFQSKDIQLLVLDVDGVLTDGGMYFTEKGDEIKRYHTRDGRAIMACKRQGIPVAFLSGGVKLQVIADRAERLGVERVYVGLEPKLGILDNWRQELNLEWEQIAYIGDDMNDRQVMEKVGLSACPQDAAPKIKEIANWVLTRNGGDACVREFIEEFLIQVER